MVHSHGWCTALSGAGPRQPCLESATITLKHRSQLATLQRINRGSGGPRIRQGTQLYAACGRDDGYFRLSVSLWLPTTTQHNKYQSINKTNNNKSVKPNEHVGILHVARLMISAADDVVSFMRNCCWGKQGPRICHGHLSRMSGLLRTSKTWSTPPALHLLVFSFLLCFCLLNGQLKYAMCYGWLTQCASVMKRKRTLILTPTPSKRLSFHYLTSND